jgi:hypothetical protein
MLRDLGPESKQVTYQDVPKASRQTDRKVERKKERNPKKRWRLISVLISLTFCHDYCSYHARMERAIILKLASIVKCK